MRSSVWLRKLEHSATKSADLCVTLRFPSTRARQDGSSATAAPRLPIENDNDDENESDCSVRQDAACEHEAIAESAVRFGWREANLLLKAHTPTRRKRRHDSPLPGRL
jgi:hypothetical protein